MVDGAARVAVGAQADVHRHLAKADGGGEMAAVLRVDAVGVESDCAFDSATRQGHSEEVEAHRLVAGGDQVNVDAATAVQAVDDARAGLLHVGRFLQIAGARAVVACSGHDDAARTHQRLQRLALKLALAH